VASAVIAIVGDGLTRARRSARNGMMGLSLQEDQPVKVHVNLPGVKPVPAGRVAHFGQPDTLIGVEVIVVC